MKNRYLILIVLSILTLSSCTSLSSIQKAPLHAGVSRTFSTGYDSALKASREALVESGTVIESATEVDPQNYIIIGKAGVSAFSWGEMVRVVITKVNDSETTVRVLTEKKIKINLTAKGDYSNSILSNIELKLRTS